MGKVTLSLDADQEAFVNARVAEGRYDDAGAYFRELVRLDQERREAASLLRRILDEAEASGVCEQTVEDVWAEAEAEYIARHG